MIVVGVERSAHAEGDGVGRHVLFFVDVARCRGNLREKGRLQIFFVVVHGDVRQGVRVGVRIRRAVVFVGVLFSGGQNRGPAVVVEAIGDDDRQGPLACGQVGRGRVLHGGPREVAVSGLHEKFSELVQPGPEGRKPLRAVAVESGKQLPGLVDDRQAVGNLNRFQGGKDRHVSRVCITGVAVDSVKADPDVLEAENEIGQGVFGHEFPAPVIGVPVGEILPLGRVGPAGFDVGGRRGVRRQAAHHFPIVLLFVVQGAFVHGHTHLVIGDAAVDDHQVGRVFGRRVYEIVGVRDRCRADLERFVSERQGIAGPVGVAQGKHRAGVGKRLAGVGRPRRIVPVGVVVEQVGFVPLGFPELAVRRPHAVRYGLGDVVAGIVEYVSAVYDLPWIGDVDPIRIFEIALDEAPVEEHLAVHAVRIVDQEHDVRRRRDDLAENGGVGKLDGVRRRTLEEHGPDQDAQAQGLRRTLSRTPPAPGRNVLPAFFHIVLH